MPDRITDLERLRTLWKAGELTDAEFEAAKGFVLNEDDPRASFDPLESIQGQNGIASEDFNDHSLSTTADDCTITEAQWQLEDHADDEAAKRWRITLLATVLLVCFVLASWKWRSPSEEVPREALVADQDVNCRSSPSTGGDIEEVVSRGSRIQLGEQSEGWSKVVDKTCWIKDNRLEIVGVKPIAQATAIQSAELHHTKPPTQVERTPDLSVAVRLLARRWQYNGYIRCSYYIIGESGKAINNGDQQATLDLGLILNLLSRVNPLVNPVFPSSEINSQSLYAFGQIHANESSEAEAAAFLTCARDIEDALEKSRR